MLATGTLDRWTLRRHCRAMAEIAPEVASLSFEDALRALESAATGSRELRAGPGATQLFVYPGSGYTFRVVDHLITRGLDYRDLFTTRRTFVTRELGAIYVLPVEVREGWEPVEFAADDPRAGILTHYAYVRKSNYLLPEMVVPLLRDAVAGRSFVDPEIEALQHAIARKLGFRLIDHRLELYGVPLDD